MRIVTLADRIRDYLELQSFLDECRADGLETERAAAAVANAKHGILSAMAGPGAPEDPALAAAAKTYLESEHEFDKFSAAGANLDAPARRMETARRDLERQLHGATRGDVETVRARRMTPPTVPVRPDDDGDPAATPGGTLRRILVPFDESVPARFALEVAVALGGRTDAELILLNVVRPATGAGGEYVCSLERLDQLHRAEGEHLLASVGRDMPRGTRWIPLITEGVPADEILIAARTWDADLIVMGTRARGRLAQFVLGGTADSVIRRAPCPVITVSRRAKWAATAAGLRTEIGLAERAWPEMASR